MTDMTEIEKAIDELVDAVQCSDGAIMNKASKDVIVKRMKIVLSKRARLLELIKEVKE